MRNFWYRKSSDRYLQPSRYILPTSTSLTSDWKPGATGDKLDELPLLRRVIGTQDAEQKLHRLTGGGIIAQENGKGMNAIVNTSTPLPSPHLSWV